MRAQCNNLLAHQHMRPQQDEPAELLICQPEALQVVAVRDQVALCIVAQHMWEAQDDLAQLLLRVAEAGEELHHWHAA